MLAQSRTSSVVRIPQNPRYKTQARSDFRSVVQQQVHGKVNQPQLIGTDGEIRLCDHEAIYWIEVETL